MPGFISGPEFACFAQTRWDERNICLPFLRLPCPGNIRKQRQG